MASLVDIMTQGQMEATDPSKAPNLGQNFAQGAQLAMQAEQIEHQRQNMEMEQQKLQQAKLEKFVTAVEKGQQYAGKAQSNYYNKFLPAYKKSLGADIDKMIPDDSLAFITSSPENVGRFHTLVADVRSGRIDAQSAIGQLNDKVKFADVTPDMYKDINEAQKSFLGNEAQMARTQATIGGAASRQQTDIATAGQVTAKKAIADEFVKYDAVGGSAGLDKTEAALKKAIKQLQTGEVKTGGLAENIPYGGDVRVLARTNKPLKALMDEVLSTQNIKALSGDPNPTQAQIDAINSRILDPAASNEVNMVKLQNELARVKADRTRKEGMFRSEGFLTQPRTYKIGGQERSAEEARSFYKANPKFLTPALKKDLGL